MSDRTSDPSDTPKGLIVVIEAFDDIPEHLFRVTDIYEDCVGG